MANKRQKKKMTARTVDSGKKKNRVKTAPDSAEPKKIYDGGKLGAQAFGGVTVTALLFKTTDAFAGSCY